MKISTLSTTALSLQKGRKGLILSALIMFSITTEGQTITFNTTGWQLNRTGGETVPTLTSGVLELTDNGGSEASSAFYGIPQYVSYFSASFTYTPSGNSAADGVAFILQDSSSGASALGADGGSLGYSGISESIAFEINIYDGHTIGIGVGTNGATGVYGPTGAVAVNSGHPINVQLNFVNGVLSVGLTDTTTDQTFNTNYAVGWLVSTLGSASAYVGFSGGTGGETSIQQISNFQFTPMNLRDLWLYDDNLDNNVRNWSWGSPLPNTNNTSPVHSGKYSIALTNGSHVVIYAPSTSPSGNEDTKEIALKPESANNALCQTELRT